jgi:hypothetical protein
VQENGSRELSLFNSRSDCVRYGMLLLPAAAAFAGIFAAIVGTLVSYPPAQGLITYAHWINFRQPLNAQLTDLRAFRLQGARN